MNQATHNPAKPRTRKRKRKRQITKRGTTTIDPLFCRFSTQSKAPKSRESEIKKTKGNPKQKKAKKTKKDPKKETNK